ncbi:DUF2155 domain-containing protein [Parasphingorhabdus sp. DH2-15]|uniref:DUF2155 domain-containing protein n=1 Tax=Parasphingorhabdus sp. DH2-15 TaxID=3444112 RepID=UPI003F6885E8
MKPGEARRIGNVVIRLEACERTAPWESPAESGAFVQVLVQSKPRRNSGEEPKWQRIFSGWLFKESPSVNVVEHPIYDVWLKNCAMRFPGEEDIIADPVADADSTSPDTAASSDSAPADSEPGVPSNSANAAGNEGSPAPSAPEAPTLPEPTIEDLLDDVDG